VIDWRESLERAKERRIAYNRASRRVRQELERGMLDDDEETVAARLRSLFRLYARQGEG
jgi:hypothetical protein